jgi:PAS domain-containing protein
MDGIPKTIDVRLAQVRALCGLDLDNSPVPMWMHDRKTLAFVAVNSAAMAFYGFSRGEFIQMTILDIRPPEDVPGLSKTCCILTSMTQMATFGDIGPKRVS